jgi:hypothetical protein
MIDCSTDRWAGISIDDASTLHSVACILHFSVVIIAISPVEGRERNALGHQTDGHRRSGNASEQCMVAADSLIQCSLFKMDQHGGARAFRSICVAAIGPPRFNFTCLKAGVTCAISVLSWSTRSRGPIRHVIKLSEPRPYKRVSLATSSSASVAYISASAARSFVVNGSLIPPARRRQCSASSLSCAAVNICIIIYLMRYGNNAFALVQLSRQEHPSLSGRCKLSAVALVVLCLCEFLQSYRAAFVGCKHLRSQIRRRDPMGRAESESVQNSSPRDNTLS